MSPLEHGVRWNADLEEFELRCNDCRARKNVAAYWPITREYWIPGRMIRCKACHMTRDRLEKRRLRTDEQRRADDNARVRRWRERNRAKSREATRRWNEKNLDRKREIDREYHQRNKEARNEASRRWRAAERMRSNGNVAA